MQFILGCVKISMLCESEDSTRRYEKKRIYYDCIGGAKMAKCEVCGKSVHFGNNVSHSHRRSNHIWKSNIKRVKCKVNGAAKRMHVCTNCLKSGKVERV